MIRFLLALALLPFSILGLLIAVYLLLVVAGALVHG